MNESSGSDFRPNSGLPPVSRNATPNEMPNQELNSRNLLEKTGDLIIKTSKLIHGYPAWLKQRRKATQFALLYSMIGVIPLILYPFSALVIHVNSYGLSINLNPLKPFVFTLLLGYAGAIAAGLIGGKTVLALYTVIGILLFPFLYVKRGEGSLGMSFLMAFLMVFGMVVGDILGVRNAPFGISTRTKATNLMTRAVAPLDGASYSSEVEQFIANNRNWISMKQNSELSSRVDFATIQYEAAIKQEEERRIAKAAQEAEERISRQISDGTYMPDQFEVSRPCKKLAEENSLTKNVDWGWFGGGNSRWFPQQKTIILEGKTKNAFGVEIPFNIECRWEKGGIVRIVEISR